MNHWVALDWGTSNFRAYLMENNNVIDQVSTQEGMKFVDQKEFENTLVKNITPWKKNLISILLLLVEW
jgi:2-dehydro-3-deoxygalactonokinase